VSGRAGIPININEKKQVMKVFGISEKGTVKIRKKCAMKIKNAGN
jgi:hypothetical protein